MQPSTAESRFKTMLAESGFDLDNPDPHLAWEVFKFFLQEPVDCAEDGALFECGTSNWTGEGQFTWGFVRQFVIDLDEENDSMEQLHCKFRCAPTDDLKKWQTNLWAFDFPTLDEYFSRVEGLEEFHNPISSPQNWTCQIEQWKV